MQQLRLFFTMAIAKNKHNCCILLDLLHYTSEMEFLNPLCNCADATNTQCFLTISRDQTTVNIHIISSYSWKS